MPPATSAERPVAAPADEQSRAVGVPPTAGTLAASNSNTDASAPATDTAAATTTTSTAAAATSTGTMGDDAIFLQPWAESITLSQWCKKVGSAAKKERGRSAREWADALAADVGGTAAAVVAEWGVQENGPQPQQKVRVWIADVDERAVRAAFGLLWFLDDDAGWSLDELDERVEITLFTNANAAVTKYCREAFPCGRIHEGDVHAMVAKLADAGKANPKLPHVAHFHPDSRVDVAVTRDTLRRCSYLRLEDSVGDRERKFGLEVQGVVRSFKRKDDVPDYDTFSWPRKATPLTLSQWYAAVNSCNAFDYDLRPVADLPALEQDQRERGQLLADAVQRAWAADPNGRRVRLWMMDGAGNIVFRVLFHLLRTWTPAELDARLELSLVDWMKAMNDYHACAIPCAKVRRGDVHKLVAATSGRLPHVMYFNYSLTTKAKGTKTEHYEPGSYPSTVNKQVYSTEVCMANTRRSRDAIRGAHTKAAIFMSYSTVRGGAETEAKIEAAGLTTTPATHGRGDFATVTL